MRTRTRTRTRLYLSVATAAPALFVLGMNHTFAQGTAFTYQGRLDGEGQTPLDGLYDFRFRVLNSATLGTVQGASLTSSAVPVQNGLFTVNLDFGAGVFNGAARWLEISVRTNGAAPFATLSPRTEITAAPYAIFAGGAAAGGLVGTLPSSLIADGSLTGLKIADGSLQSADLADAVVTSPKIADGTIASVDLAAGAVTSAKLASDVGVWSKSGANLFYSGGNVGVGTVPSAPLQVDGIVRSTGAAGGNFQAYNPNNGTAHVDLSWLNDQARLRVGGSGEGSLNGLSIQGTSDKTLFRVSQFGDATLLESLAIGTNVFLDNNESGGGAQFSMQNANARITVDLDADQGDGGSALSLINADGVNTVVLDADNSGGGYFRLRDAANENRAVISGTSLGVTQSLYNSNRLSVLSLDTSATAGGRIIARNSTGNDRVLIEGQGADGGGEIILENASGNASIILSGTEADGVDVDEGGQILFRNADGTATIQIDGDDPDGGGVIALANQSGTTTIELDANRTGGGRVTTQVLEITGGSDLSEHFDIVSLHQEVQAGHIVSIDPRNTGRLVISGKPYDRTVAGVVSGAGGVKPGMLMGQRGSVADGKHPIALTGRVYCWVDAEAGGAIEPGDLLTTSETLGHAMKVTDHSRAQGAIVGKAMTSLASGKGLVLVLVSLQ